MEQLQSKLIQELSSLRKGGGLAPHKLQQKPTIRTLVARATNTSADNLTDNQVYNFMLSELSRLASTNTVAALKNAFGIDSHHKKLFLRRSELAAKLAKHPDTIERYENQGINNFAAHLTERSLHFQAKDESLSSPLYL